MYSGEDINMLSYYYYRWAKPKTGKSTRLLLPLFNRYITVPGPGMGYENIQYDQSFSTQVYHRATYDGEPVYE